MGCGSSSANQVYEPETAGYKGPVNITVKHAVLTRDVNFIDKMDPYVVLKMGD